MEIGKKIYQLRKLSGMTQDQLAEKLHVSRQTISKWEQGATMPDLESVVRLSQLFQVSLNELLLEQGEVREQEKEQFQLADLLRLQAQNQRRTLLLFGGLIFLMISVLSAVFVTALQETTTSTQYMLYRYIAIGEYAALPVDYGKLLLPSAGAAVIGVILCVSYGWFGRNDRRERDEKREKRYWGNLVVLVILAVLAVFILYQKEKKDPYESVVSDVGTLGQDRIYTYVETNAEYPVLLMTDNYYNDGEGRRAGIYCDVYYMVDGELKQLGTIYSRGTAYPIACDETGIYAVSLSELGLCRYEVSEDGLKLVEEVCMYSGEGDEIIYTRIVDGQEETITEEAYNKSWKKYAEAEIVNFMYGRPADKASS